MRRSIFRRQSVLLAALAGAGFCSSIARQARANSAPINADIVENYTPGDLGVTYASYDVTSAALGPMNGDTGEEFGFKFGALNPFNPAFLTSDIVAIGGGGSMTLHLSAPVQTIGVFSNNGLEDLSADGSGLAGSDPTAMLFTEPPPEVVVSVSSDGTYFTTLNGGAPIVFDAPANYYADAPAISNYYQPLGSVAANEDLPWYDPTTLAYGTLSSLEGMDYSQMVSTFAGSAGGTWFDTGTSASYVTFTVPDGQIMTIDALGGVAVPEPIVPSIVFTLSAIALLRRRHNHA